MSSEYKVIDNCAYYYGAENFIQKEWVLLSNYPKTRHIETPFIIKQSGLVCRINPHATDRFGNKIPDSFAVELPAELGLYEQEPVVNKMFSLSIELSKAYEQRFYEQGIVSKDYFSWKKPCYVGCEEEYGLPKPKK